MRPDDVASNAKIKVGDRVRVFDAGTNPNGGRTGLVVKGARGARRLWVQLDGESVARRFGRVWLDRIN